MRNWKSDSKNGGSFQRRGGIKRSQPLDNEQFDSERYRNRYRSGQSIRGSRFGLRINHWRLSARAVVVMMRRFFLFGETSRLMTRRSLCRCCRFRRGIPDLRSEAAPRTSGMYRKNDRQDGAESFHWYRAEE